MVRGLLTWSWWVTPYSWLMILIIHNIVLSDCVATCFMSIDAISLLAPDWRDIVALWMPVWIRQCSLAQREHYIHKSLLVQCQILSLPPSWFSFLPQSWFSGKYSWWKKSCTIWYGKYPVIYRVSYILSVVFSPDFFLPSTVGSSKIGFPRSLYFHDEIHGNVRYPPQSYPPNK